MLGLSGLSDIGNVGGGLRSFGSGGYGFHWSGSSRRLFLFLSGAKLIFAYVFSSFSSFLFLFSRYVCRCCVGFDFGDTCKGVCLFDFIDRGVTTLNGRSHRSISNSLRGILRGSFRSSRAARECTSTSTSQSPKHGTFSTSPTHTTRQGDGRIDLACGDVLRQLTRDPSKTFLSSLARSNATDTTLANTEDRFLSAGEYFAQSRDSKTLLNGSPTRSGLSPSPCLFFGNFLRTQQTVSFFVDFLPRAGTFLSRACTDGTGNGTSLSPPLDCFFARFFRKRFDRSLASERSNKAGTSRREDVRDQFEKFETSDSGVDCELLEGLDCLAADAALLGCIGNRLIDQVLLIRGLRRFFLAGVLPHTLDCTGQRSVLVAATKETDDTRNDTERVRHARSERRQDVRAASGGFFLYSMLTCELSND